MFSSDLGRSKLAFGLFPLFLGIVFIVIARLPFHERQVAREWMTSTTGTVADIGKYGRARINYVAQDGKTYYVLSKKAGFGSWSVGETATVYYDPQIPHVGQIDAITEVHPAHLVFGFGGALFAGIGLLFLGALAHSYWLRTFLRRRGRRIEAKLVRIGRVDWLSINGREPWRLEVEWQDPSTREVRQFYSEQLWESPVPYCRGRSSIDVLVDPDRPERYWVDTSFLPQ